MEKAMENLKFLPFNVIYLKTSGAYLKRKKLI